MIRTAWIVLLALVLAAPACREKTRRRMRDLVPGVPARVGGEAPAEGSRGVLRGGKRLGVPLHPGPRARAVSGRLPNGTPVEVVDATADGRWVKVRARSGAGGWITRRYLDEDAPRSAGTSPARPPGDDPAGATCPLPATPLSTDLLAAAPADVPEAGPAAPAPAPTGRITVASYNVWELYDGQGGDRYLARDHADALDAAGVARRVAALGAQLKAAQPHVVAFQEIEDARLACRVAAAAVPGARWRCAAGRWARGPSPQNVALATRIGGSFRVLSPKGRSAKRGAVELLVAGGRLRILSVHLKSSRGARGVQDCPNALARYAMATALVKHLGADPRTAALVVGDFNVDPPRARHDRTDAVLTAAGLVSLVARFHPGGAPATYPRFRSTIDLAYFRAAAGVRAEGYAVLETARSDRTTSDHRPITVTLGLGAP
jgi:hypothetical protein